MEFKLNEPQDAPSVDSHDIYPMTNNDTNNEADSEVKNEPETNASQHATDSQNDESKIGIVNQYRYYLDKYVSTKLYRMIGFILNHIYFQNFIILLIVVNSVMMGVATYPVIRLNYEAILIFDSIDKYFLIIFTVELVMNLSYHGIHFFTDGWLVFDFFIVLSSWLFSQIQVIRAFRIFRAFRIIGRFPSLRMIVISVLSILPQVYTIFLLLLIIFYIFSVLFTSLYDDLYAEGLTSDNFFSRLDYTAFTLFQVMCLDDWSGIAREVQESQKTSYIFFIAYILMASFIVVNMIIGVICESIRQLRFLDKEKKSLNKERRDSLTCVTNEVTMESVQEMLDKLGNSIANCRRVQERSTRMIDYLDTQLLLQNEKRVEEIKKRSSFLRGERPELRNLISD